MAKARTSEEREQRRERCISNYSSKTKLNAVKRWRERLLKCKDLNVQKLADLVGKHQPRISEYMSFLIEPPDDTFYQIEQIIYDHGG